MIRGVTFDLEGPIVNCESLHFESFSHACRDQNFIIDFPTIIRELPQVIGGGDQKIAEEISGFSKGKVIIPQLIERKKHYYDQALQEREQLQPRAGFLTVLDWIICAAELPVAIGSSTPREEAEILLQKSGVRDWFSDNSIICAEDVTDRKPAPDVYLETAYRMKINPDEQLIFEDSVTGLRAVKAAGSIGIAIPLYHFSHILTSLIEAGAERIFMEWTEMNIKALIANLNTSQLIKNSRLC